MSPITRVLLALALLYSVAGCSKKAPKEASSADLSKATDIFSGAAPTQQPAADPNRVVAKVDGQPITAAYLQNELSTILLRLRRQLPPERIQQQMDEIRRQALDSLISKQLLIQAVDDEKIAVTDDAVTARIEEMRSSLPAGMTLEDYLKRGGLTMDLLAKSVKVEMRINKLLKDKTGSIEEPTEEAIQAFYNDNPEQFAAPEAALTEQIAIRVPPDADDKTRAELHKQAEALQTAMASGKPLEELLQNADPQSIRGGRVSFMRTTTPPELVAAVFNSETGKVSGVIESRMGLHVLKVLERKPAHTLSLEETHDQIAAYLKGKAREKKIQDYLATLREKADIEIIPES